MQPLIHIKKNIDLLNHYGTHESTFILEEQTMNKKLLTSLLCSTFLFGLSACSSHDTSSSNTKNEQETSKETKMMNLATRILKKNFPPMEILLMYTYQYALPIH